MNTNSTEALFEILQFSTSVAHSLSLSHTHTHTHTHTIGSTTARMRYLGINNYMYTLSVNGSAKIKVTQL